MFRVLYSLEQAECSEKDFIARTDVWGYTFAYDKQACYIVLLAGEYALKIITMPTCQNNRSRYIKREIQILYTEDSISKELQRTVKSLKASKINPRHQIADAIIAAYGDKLKKRQQP